MKRKASKRKNLQPVRIKIQGIAWVDENDVAFRRRLTNQICMRDDTDFLKLHKIFGSEIGLQITVESDWYNKKGNKQ